MSWDYDRVRAAVADVERAEAERGDQDSHDLKPGPLPGSDYERVQKAAAAAEARHTADEPTREEAIAEVAAEMEAERQANRDRRRFEESEPEHYRGTVWVHPDYLGIMGTSDVGGEARGANYTAERQSVEGSGNNAPPWMRIRN